MDATRRARLQAVIQEELSMIIPRELKDPRIPMLTITNVVVTQDGSQATVYIAILGDQKNYEDPKSLEVAKERMKNALSGLSSAAGFLRRHIAKILTIRHVPTLLFKEDKGLENVTRVHELLRQIDDEK